MGSAPVVSCRLTAAAFGPLVRRRNRTASMSPMLPVHSVTDLAGLYPDHRPPTTRHPPLTTDHCPPTAARRPAAYIPRPPPADQRPRTSPVGPADRGGPAAA